MKFESIQPRFLRYRGHYKIYVMVILLISVMNLAFWAMRLFSDGLITSLQNYPYELVLSGLYFLITLSFFYFWLRPRLKRSIQVFPDQLVLTNGKIKEPLLFSEIENVNRVCWSIFYVKMKNGTKHYFNSSVDRVDYIWEGIFQARPDLINEQEFEEFRIKLVQYDHHQKRKEWFFRHKMVDIFNWFVMPALFLGMAYIVQSQSIIIHQQGVYFFRLFMFCMLVLLSTAFLYSVLTKKLVFDKKISENMENAENKIRDLEFEGVVLQRSKVLQMITASFVLAMIIRLDVNLYSVTKVKEDIASFKLKKGRAVLIDNRYNCLGCKYQIHDGDFIVFGRGTIGQVLAKEGDMVGQVTQDFKGRMLASENVQEVPRGHIAVKAANGKDIVFVKLAELIGKIQN